jgi:hypothetical protein
MRCWRELGAPDPNCPATLANANAAGMTTAVYFFPDAQMDAATQALMEYCTGYLKIYIPL